MKKITLFAGICLGLLATACGKKALDLPATDTLSYGLNSNITLIKGFNEFNTQDYIIDPAKVDSVTCDQKGIEVKLSEDKNKVTLNMLFMRPLANLTLWVEGVPYSILLKRSDKIDYTSNTTLTANVGTRCN